MKLGVPIIHPLQLNIRVQFKLQPKKKEIYNVQRRDGEKLNFPFKYKINNFL